MNPIIYDISLMQLLMLIPFPLLLPTLLWERRVGVKDDYELITMCAAMLISIPALLSVVAEKVLGPQGFEGYLALLSYHWIEHLLLFGGVVIFGFYTAYLIRGGRIEGKKLFFVIVLFVTLSTLLSGMILAICR